MKIFILYFLSTEVCWMRKKPSQGNQTFCMAPWTHTYISPQSERRMCCASTEPAQNFTQYIDTAEGSGEYTPMTLDEHWNSPHMMSVRKRMMAGEELPECKVCTKKLLHTTVYRDYFNSLFGRYIDDAFEQTTDQGHTDMPVISFDYRFSNLCNFKCRMCGSMLSSSWEAEDKINDPFVADRNPWMKPDIKKQIQSFQKDVVNREFEDAINKKIIEECYWVGGEPLMYEEHWRYMKQMVDNGVSKQVKARYNTNLSRIEHKGVRLFEDLLQHFQNWQICASIDGTGAVGEWIRTGLKYDTFIKNFEHGLKFAKNNPRKMQLDFTLTLPGLFEIEKMFDLSVHYDVVIISKIVFAFSPDIVLSPMALPRAILDAHIDKILANIKPRAGWKQQGMIDMLENMKTRPTFEEQWPDEFKQGMAKGKKRQLHLESIRQQPITINQILSQDVEIYQWWDSAYA